MGFLAGMANQRKHRSRNCTSVTAAVPSNPPLFPVDIHKLKVSIKAMTAAVVFDNVGHADLADTLSFTAECGRSTLLLTAREDENALLVRLLVGREQPHHGTIYVKGQNLRELTNGQLHDLRQHLGVVTPNGGLVSNLKLWENITLPLFYTSGSISEDSEARALELLREFGYGGNLLALPAHLSLAEKRMVAFIRAALCTPRIMIYAGCFDAQTALARKALATAAFEFHKADAERASLYLCSSVEPPADIHYDTLLRLH